VDGREIIGEAKAHENTISGQDVSAFVGKALPFTAKPKGGCSALFLSASLLSPEAGDYLSTIQNQALVPITVICGAQLEQEVIQKLKFPEAQEVDRLVRSKIPYPLYRHILHSNLGTYILVVGSGTAASPGDRFALISGSGEIIGETDLVRAARSHLKFLQELQFVGEETVNEEQGSARSLPYGLILATEWSDYRRPAGRSFFVGRESALAKARSAIASSDARVVEIKARSGVGKSSLLAVLEEQWTMAKGIVELHDARDVQSSGDVLLLIQRFVGKDLGRLEDIPETLKELDRKLEGNTALFLVDQFESTFQYPEVFSIYEYFALCVARHASKCSFIYARKDDLLTTHDDMAVSLDRLRGIAHPISLEDFDPAESIELIRKVATGSRLRVSPHTLSQIAQFSKGFPWLIKRTMAHIKNITKKGVTQQELLSEGLHLEDLFEEELSELDEHERGYLARIASVLPATYQSLSRRFEGDPFLREMLEKLTQRRLLRLSSGTYDTYNDVFKDFILYERMPEREHSYLFRLGPVPTMQYFRSMGGKQKVVPEEFRIALGKTTINAVYNILREIRLIGLVLKRDSEWFVPDVVRQYEHQGRLGEYVRQSVLKNRCLSDFILRVERGEVSVRQQAIPYLKECFPFIEVKDHVWEQYANMLIDWSVRLKFLIVEDDALAINREDKELSITELGNLYLTGRAAKSNNQHFMPGSAFSTALSLVRRCEDAPVDKNSLRRGELTAALDLLRVGALVSDSCGILTSRMKEDRFLEHVKSLFSTEPYKKFFESISVGSYYDDAVRKDLGENTLSSATCVWRGKKLANWGKSTGFLRKGRLVRRPAGKAK
jgi:hypothetical protein